MNKPFRRMTYADAVKYCNEHNIYKDPETKTHFEFGDVRSPPSPPLDSSFLHWDSAVFWSVMILFSCSLYE